MRLGPGVSASPLVGGARSWDLWLWDLGFPELMLACWLPEQGPESPGATAGPLVRSAMSWLQVPVSSRVGFGPLVGGVVSL